MCVCFTGRRDVARGRGTRRRRATNRHVCEQSSLVHRSTIRFSSLLNGSTHRVHRPRLKQPGKLLPGYPIACCTPVHTETQRSPSRPEQRRQWSPVQRKQTTSGELRQTNKQAASSVTLRPSVMIALCAWPAWKRMCSSRPDGTERIINDGGTDRGECRRVR
eukprot:4458981-Prymnesium_polylepis.1